MNEKIVEAAAKAMKVSVQVAKENHKLIPEHNLYYFWNPVRGGISVIINDECEKLAAVSGVKFEKHLEAFLNGKRN